MQPANEHDSTPRLKLYRCATLNRAPAPAVTSHKSDTLFVADAEIRRPYNWIPKLEAPKSCGSVVPQRKARSPPLDVHKCLLRGSCARSQSQSNEGVLPFPTQLVEVQVTHTGTRLCRIRLLAVLGHSPHIAQPGLAQELELLHRLLILVPGQEVTEPPATG